MADEVSCAAIGTTAGMAFDAINASAGMVTAATGAVATASVNEMSNQQSTESNSTETQEVEEQAPEEQKPIEEMTEEEIKEMEEAEEARLAALQESYIVHTAMIKCSYAVRPSRVIIPISHGEYIHGIDQLNVGDSKPIQNIQSFGVCRSPLNPSVQAAAAKIKAEVQSRKKSFMDKVMDFFSKSPPEDTGEDLVKDCAGVCTPVIAMEWVDGKEDVLIDGKPALLGRCKLQCGYDGEITLYTSGQME